MARVRMPKSAESLLVFMEKDLRPSAEAFFPTYAHMIVFAASVGYEAKKFDDDPAFIKSNPEPIDVEVFRNRGLYRFLQLLAIAREETHEVARDEEKLAAVLEGYASAGFGIVKGWYDDKGGSDPVFVQHLIGQIMQRSAMAH